MEIKEKKNLIELFMDGSRRGMRIAVNQIIPAMVLGYVIIRFLNLTNLMDLLGVVLGPVMAIFGLPGEAFSVLIAAFFAKASGAAAAALLFEQGVINAGQALILLIPSMCMGTLVGHYARIVLVADVQPKHKGLMLAVPLVTSAIGMLIMRVILSFTGVL